MARGRLVSRTLGSSRKYAALLKEAGKLGEFCQVLYPLIVANTDDFGRMAGDAFTVKHAVFPTSPRRESEFQAALVAMHNAQLIVLYADDAGQSVIQVRQFETHQPGLSKRTKSRFSEPPVKFTEIREVPKQLNRTELKGTEGKRTEPLQSPEEPGTDEDSAKKAENREIAEFLVRFCSLYREHRHGARYFVVKEKHVPLLRPLLRAYGLERLDKLAQVLLRTDDEWVAGTDRGIGILSTKASWLDERLSAAEAQIAPVVDWWDECKALHGGACEERMRHHLRMQREKAS